MIEKNSETPALTLKNPDAAFPYYQERRRKLQASLAQEEIDALLVTALVNVRYLSGFSGSAGSLLVTPEDVWFLTDFRYTTQAARQTRGLDLLQYRERNELVAETLKNMGAKRLGFEADHLTATGAGALATAIDGIKAVPTTRLVEAIRLVKDAMEIETIRWLMAKVEKVFPQAKALIRPGMVERDVAIEIEYLLKKEGCDGAAFEFIVASGERSSMPHGVASDKVIQKDEMVTLDWGAKGEGYHTDTTRTFATGNIDPELKAIFDLTLEANLAAIDVVRPGVAVRDIDAAARGLIDKAGYGEAFGHGTGHGVGLDIHEKPSVSWRDDTVAEEGMIFTIEPGIYLPGKGGVRIEDMALVTASGCEILTSRLEKSYTIL